MLGGVSDSSAVSYCNFSFASAPASDKNNCVRLYGCHCFRCVEQRLVLLLLCHFPTSTNTSWMPMPMPNFGTIFSATATARCHTESIYHMYVCAGVLMSETKVCKWVGEEGWRWYVYSANFVNREPSSKAVFLDSYNTKGLFKYK